MQPYTEKVIETFMNPQNVGRMPDADGIGKVGNPQCGDIMQIFIKVKDNVIYDIKFLTLGCAAAIATSSIATQMVKGKTIEEALKITNKEVVNALGGLPPEKHHCSVLAEDGIRAAIEDYLSKHPEHKASKS
jgi:nitrogen fixation NifU-like protein